MSSLARESTTTVCSGILRIILVVKRVEKNTTAAGIGPRTLVRISGSENGLMNGFFFFFGYHMKTLEEQKEKK